MKKFLPKFYDLTEGDKDLRVYFDYEPAEQQYFNPLVGIGSPGYPACVEIVRIEPPVILSPEEIEQVEQEIIERIEAELE